MNIFRKLFRRNDEAVIADTETAPERVQLAGNAEPLPLTDKEESKETEEPRQTTFKEAVEMKYPKQANTLIRMFEAANLCSATWENVTKVRLQRFVDYMAERLAPNSVAQYATKMKAVLNLYSDEVILPRGFAKILTPKKVAVQNVYLTEDEIQLLVGYNPKNDREALVRAQFCIGVLTLARHSDYCHFDESNIIGGNLVYVSRKTKIQSSVPASATLVRFLKEQKELVGRGVKVCDDGFNEIIRRICMKCGIDEPVKLYQRGELTTKPKWQYVSSHTARRTGVTNLYLRGLDLLTIAKIAGHNNTATTMNYICCGVRELPKEAQAYFAGF